MSLNGRQFGGGLGGQVMAKQWSKYNPIEGKSLLDWIGHITGEEVPTKADPETFRLALKDGQLLCKLINSLHPSAIPKVMTGTQPFAHMANIESFLVACRHQLNLSPDVLFRTVDLTERRDLFSVTTTLRALGRKASELGRETPAEVGKDSIRSTT